MNAVIAPDTSEGASLFVGTLLRRARLAAQLTADDLAAQIGVSETTVRRWEGEFNQPTTHHLARLATVLAVAPRCPTRGHSAPNVASQPARTGTAEFVGCCEAFWTLTQRSQQARAWPDDQIVYAGRSCVSPHVRLHKGSVGGRPL